MTRLRRLLDLYRARWGRLEAILIMGAIVAGALLMSLCAPACSPAAENRAQRAEGFAKAFCAEWLTQADAGTAD